MAPLAVVEDLDVLSNRGFRICPGCITAVMYEFIFEASPEAIFPLL